MKYWEREGENVKEKKDIAILPKEEVMMQELEEEVKVAPSEMKDEEVKEPMKEYTCKYCGEIFEKPVQIAQHVRHMHKTERKPKEAAEAEAEAEAIIEPEEPGKIIDVVEETQEKAIEEIDQDETKVAEVVAHPEVVQQIRGAEERLREKGIRPIAAIIPAAVREMSQPKVVRSTDPQHLDTTAQVDIGVTSNVQPIEPLQLQQQPLLQQQQMINPLQIVRDKYEPLLMNYPHVTGITFGMTPDQRPAIIIVVCKKGPEHDKLPKQIDGIPLILKEVLPEKRKKTIFDKLLSSEQWGVFTEGPLRRAAREFINERKKIKGVK